MPFAKFVQNLLSPILITSILVSPTLVSTVEAKQPTKTAQCLVNLDNAKNQGERDTKLLKELNRCDVVLIIDKRYNSNRGKDKYAITGFSRLNAKQILSVGIIVSKSDFDNKKIQSFDLEHSVWETVNWKSTLPDETSIPYQSLKQSVTTYVDLNLNK
jgi:hypothetical protein